MPAMSLSAEMANVSGSHSLIGQRSNNRHGVCAFSDQNCPLLPLSWRARSHPAGAIAHFLMAEASLSILT